MAEIITAKGTGFFIEKVIRGARERIVLISPYLKVQKLYLDELKGAANRGIKVSVLFREDEAKQDQIDALLEVKGVALFCLPELHAKCYFNEHRFVLTSMNLHDHSERNNKELGIMLEQGSDEPLFQQAVESAQRILEHAAPFATKRSAGRSMASMPKEAKAKPRVTSVYRASTKHPHEQAYCIRCADRINFDVERPFCSDCYWEWAQWQNEDYKEEHCHRCGQERTTSFAKPLCRMCYDAA